MFLIAYYSDTGNMKKVVEAIPQEKDLSNISQLKDLKGYDLIFFGFPLHASRLPKKPAKFLKAHSKGKKIALFCTQRCAQGFIKGDILKYFNRQFQHHRGNKQSMPRLARLDACLPQAGSGCCAPYHDPWDRASNYIQRQ